MMLSAFRKWVIRQFALGATRRPTPNNDKAETAIASDAPIRTAAEDKLRRVPFASRIAQVLSEPFSGEGRVFAIRAAWGDGKTSLKNLIIEQLASTEAPTDWLDFNPWQWGDSDTIARALFQQMADKLGGPYSSAAAVRSKKLRTYGAILTGAGESIKSGKISTQAISSALTAGAITTLAGAVGFNLPTAARVSAILAILALIVSLSGHILAFLGKDRTAEPLDKIRPALEESLRSPGRPLIVFVDDIDRLEPGQIRLLFRQIKANANLPNIVFVTLFQPSIVEAALNPIANNEGRKFLEKIVQANFDLPTIPRSTVHRVFTEELAVIANDFATEENGFETVRWGNVLIGCIQPYVGNLRDARRLVSSIAIHLPLHANENAFEVNIVDFLALETLRVFEPDLHRALFENGDLFTSRVRYGGNADSKDRERAERVVNVVQGQRRNFARDAVKELFPTIAWAFGGTNYGESWDERWIREKRVCTKRFFAQYFELQTPEGEISQDEFASFIAASDDRDRIADMIDHIERRQLLTSFAARLDESVNTLPVENAAIILPAIFRVGEKLANASPTDPFNAPFVSAWRAASWYVERLPEAERGTALLRALQETGALSVAAVLIHLDDPSDRTEEEAKAFEPKIAAAPLQTLKDEWLRQIRELASNGGLLEHRGLANMLYRWRDYSGGLDEPRAWVEKVSQTDEGFSAFVSKLVSISTTHAWGDRVSKLVDRIDRQTIEDFIGLEKARLRLDRVRDSGAVDSPALKLLREHLDEWQSKPSG